MAVAVPFLINAAVAAGVQIASTQLFGTKASVEGARLNSLKAPQNGYGGVVKRIYGSARVGGTLIWLQNDKITETKRVDTTGSSLFSKGTKVTSYKYFLTCAVAFSESVPNGGILRIWADNVLIFDRSAAGDTTTIQQNSKYFPNSDSQVGEVTDANDAAVTYGSVDVFNGTETQLAPAVILNDVSESPAYRGTTYALIKNLNLEPFGNRIPSFSAEITSNDISSECATKVWAGASQSGVVSARVVDGILELGDAAAGTGNTWEGSIDRYNLLTREYLGQEFNAASDPEAINGAAVPVWWRPDLRHGSNVELKTGGGALPAGTRYQGETWIGSTVKGYGGIEYTDVEGEPLLAQLDNTKSCAISDRFVFFRCALKNYTIGDSAESIARNSVGFRRLSLQGGTPLSDKLGTSVNASVDYDPVTGSLYIYDQDTLKIWEIPDPSIFPEVSSAGAPLKITANIGLFYEYADPVAVGIVKQGSFYADKLYCSISGSDPGLRIYSIGRPAPADADPYVGTLTQLCSVDKTVYSSTRCKVISPQLLMNTNGVWAINTGEKGAETLAAVQADICERHGLSSSEYDVTDLASIDVDGYVIDTLQSGKEYIQELRTAYEYDAFESGYKIKFKRRGGSSVVSLTNDDLSAREHGQFQEDPIFISRESERSLPRQLRMTYLTPVTYDPYTVSDERLVSSAEMEHELNLPIVLTAKRGQEIVSAAIFSAWVAREKLVFTLSYQQLALEPADPVTITSDGEVYVVRLTRVEKGRPGLVRCEGELEEATVYVQTQAETVDRDDSDNQYLPINTPTVIEAVDGPMLQPADDGVGVHYISLPTSPDYPGAQVEVSPDDFESFIELERQAVQTGWGFLNTAPTAPSVVEVIDGNVFEITPIGGYVPESATRDEIHQGKNLVLVGDDGRWEVMQFMTAIDNFDGTYDITGLFRGLRGTEGAMGSHIRSDKLILINLDGIDRYGSSAELNTTQYYRSISEGLSSDSARSDSAVHTGRALRPNAPIHASAIRPANNDIDLKFLPRTRYPQTNETFACPQLDNDNVFEIDVMNGSTVVRTFTNTDMTFTADTYTTLTYTSAQQVTDFGSTQSSVVFRFYQLNVTVGRGLALEETL